MIQETWGGFFTIVCIALSAFCVGRLWEYEVNEREEERRAARRRAYRLHKEGNR
jgi:hypothetical protein